jgi:hypothetical protein
MDKAKDKKLSSSIIVDGDIHNDFKIFCKGKNLKIGGIVEKLISLYMKKYKELEKMIDETLN